jgi:hypothetical protein
LPLYGVALIDNGGQSGAHQAGPAMIHKIFTLITPGLREKLVERDDLLLVYSLYSQIEQQILGMLLGLNRLYLPPSVQVVGTSHCHDDHCA